ncbi:MAG: hypothetical protein WC540_14050, partial [Sulfuritalea sp.]
EPDESVSNGQLTCQKEYFIAFALYAFPDSRVYASIHRPAKARVPKAHRPHPIPCKIDTIFKKLAPRKELFVTLR